MRHARLTSFVVATLASAVLTTVGAWPAAAAAGDLDSSFGGGDGQVTVKFAAGGGWADAVMVQKNGKIVVAGVANHTVDDRTWVITRFTPGGGLDPTFGTNGRVFTNITGGDDQAYALVPGGHGRIVVGGYAGERFAAVRYLPDGHLDHTFSGDGKAFVSFASGPAFAYGMARAPGGKFVLAGQVENSTGASRFGVARLTSTGALDSSFSGDGKATTKLGAESFAYDVLVRSDGSVVATGDANTLADIRPGVAWYRPDGTLDSNMGDGGTIIDDVGEDLGPTGMVAVANGKIVVDGAYRTSPATFKLGLVRFTAKGQPDETFGPNGLVTRDLGGTSDYPERIRRVGGKLVIALGDDRDSSEHLGVVRLESNGALDTGFGDQGLALATVEASFGYGIAVQGDGKIVAVGSAGTSVATSKFVVARFLAS
jgi:uncharacterized delta-60 repeat protein